MNKENGFPKKKELRQAVLIGLNNLGGLAATAEINKEVILLLNLPEDVVSFKHPDGLCTLLDYRLRWVRTELKKEGFLTSVKRGTWKLANEKN